jgi:16S rRNA (cytidine1402-2'-O)-methyltransferase
MSGTLFLVATPIGNLEDITLRALRVLREVELVAAEDTRRTAILLTHHGIATRTISFHEHNTRSRVPQVVARLKAGERVALVSDAGTPGISDPGMELVQACIRGGIPVDPIPGANAHISSAVVSGFPLDPLTMLGFPPNKGAARRAWLAQLAQIEGTVVFLESPHRVQVTLEEAGDYLGGRPMMLARELTKIHQEFIRGTAGELARQCDQLKGEITLVVGPKQAVAATRRLLPDEAIATAFWQTTTDRSLQRRDAIAATAERLGISKKQVYAAVERTKKLAD